MEHYPSGDCWNESDICVKHRGFRFSQRQLFRIDVCNSADHVRGKWRISGAFILRFNHCCCDVNLLCGNEYFLRNCQ